VAKLLKKLSDGREVFAYDFKDVEVKVLGDYEIQLIGSTDVPDRDNEVLMQDGWDLKNYKKNPVVLPAHNYSSPAIGRAKKVKLEDGKLTFDIEFPQEGVNPVADVYRKLYKSGFMNASSVGFIPSEWKDGKGPKEPRRTFMKQELLEISLVSVPANPEALVTSKSLGIDKAVEKGVITQEDMDRLDEELKKMFPQAKDEAPKVPEVDVTKVLKDLMALDSFRCAVAEIVAEKMKEEMTKLNPHYSTLLFGEPEPKTHEATPEKKHDVVETVSEVEIAKAVKEAFAK
jgi:HK97 family phage prohead protease